VDVVNTKKEPGKRCEYWEYSMKFIVLGSTPISGEKFPLFSATSFLCLGETQRPIQSILGFFHVIKRSGQDVGHLPPSNASVTKYRQPYLYSTYINLDRTGFTSRSTN
jgi:hypothetical protein